MPEGQLLVPEGGVIHGVQVERQVTRRALEGGEELVEEDLTQPLEGLDADGVLEAGQRRLAGQVGGVGALSGTSLKTGWARRVSWSF